MATFGEVLNHVSKGYGPRKMPFQKDRPIRVTATFKATTLLGNPRKESGIFWGSFMDVIGKAQARWPGAQLRIQTLDMTPEWLKEMQENAKRAEEVFATAIEGQES
jgi:hypothetical protein